MIKNTRLAFQTASRQASTSNKPLISIFKSGKFFNRLTLLRRFRDSALGPLDGRYRNKVEPLDYYFSERAYNRYRVQVEFEWLKFLVRENITEIDEKNRSIDSIISKMS